MTESRIYLDAQGGQRPDLAVLGLTRAMAELSWTDGNSRHYEAALGNSAVGMAIESLAKSFQVPIENLLPIHRLGNVFEILSNIYPQTAVSTASRKGAIQIFKGQKLSVDHFGRVVDFPKVQSFLVPAANQETGVIEDIENLILKTGGTAIVDATEWIGRSKNLPSGEIIIARASSWGGPNSVCFIISRDKPLPIENRKAKSLRPDNFELLMAASAFENLEDLSQSESRIKKCSYAIRDELSKHKSVTIHGDDHSLPHLISFDIENIDSETASISFDKAGIAVGSGSACSVESSQTSHVLEAMGIKSAGNIRISIPLDFSEQNLQEFLVRLPKIIAELTQTL